ncbi:hypothetical protein CHUAL_011152 [Chamberlinius hualienensis]
MTIRIDIKKLKKGLEFNVHNIDSPTGIKIQQTESESISQGETWVLIHSVAEGDSCIPVYEVGECVDLPRSSDQANSRNDEDWFSLNKTDPSLLMFDVLVKSDN